MFRDNESAPDGNTLIHDGYSVSTILIAFTQLAVILSATCVVQSEVFQFTAGSSSLFQATGGSMRVLTTDSEMSFGIGLLNGSLTTGGLYRRRWKAITVTVGDDLIPVRLPTDLFDSSHYFFGRGVSAVIQRERTRMFVFAGATSDAIGAPFFQGGSSNHGAGAVFIERRISRNLHLFSRNIFSARQTNLGGIDWQPVSILKASLSGGIGAGHGYFGSGLSIETQLISLKAGYVATASDFQRVLVSAPVTSENNGGNFLLTVRPRPFFDLTAAHFNLQEPLGRTTNVVHASLDQYSAGFRRGGTRATASLFRSTTDGLFSIGSSLSLTQDLSSRLQVSANLFRSRTMNASSLTSVVAMFRETVSSRLSLNQVVNHANSGTNASWGGDFLSNPLSVGVNYQTVYSPFFPKSPFRQVLLFTLHLQLTHLFQLNTSTYVGADGSPKYTTYGGMSGFHTGSDFGTGDSFRFPQYIVRGKVVDERGEAIAGVALRIGPDMVFSDSHGEFFVREKKRRPIRIEVVLKDFTTPGNFGINSCPPTALPTSSDSRPVVYIVLNRRRKLTPAPD